MLPQTNPRSGQPWPRFVDAASAARRYSRSAWAAALPSFGRAAACGERATHGRRGPKPTLYCLPVQTPFGCLAMHRLSCPHFFYSRLFPPSGFLSASLRPSRPSSTRDSAPSWMVRFTAQEEKQRFRRRSTSTAGYEWRSHPLTNRSECLRRRRIRLLVKEREQRVPG